MTDEPLPSLQRYERHLEATGGWLLRSVERGRGGSCASFSLVSGWQRPYPETTGYIIPTLIDIADHTGQSHFRKVAERLGGWLLGIQSDAGWWAGDLHPPRDGVVKPSVFNSGQILKGMVALFCLTGESQWRDAALRCARWLAQGVGPDGTWPGRDYQSEVTPTYYTRVAWPMLEVWKVTEDEAVRDAAIRVLDACLARRRDNGAFDSMSFWQGKAAFTHTIAYTLRGFLESARMLESFEPYGEAARKGVEVMVRRAELRGGQLPGAYDERWRKSGTYVCLTGNAQLALCALMLEEREPDLRLVNAAAKLVDVVCRTQMLRVPMGGMRGGVAGSWPVWGRYMRLRYPNWAAKFHADALLALIRRVRHEMEPTP